MNDRIVTVFGGTGFLGRRVVRHLRQHGFSVRIASRHPDRGQRLFGPDDPQLQSVKANIHDERSFADALARAYGAVNAVSLYVEHGVETFHSVHVESAQQVATQARRAGVERLAHVSGLFIPCSLRRAPRRTTSAGAGVGKRAISAWHNLASATCRAFAQRCCWIIARQFSARINKMDPNDTSGIALLRITSVVS